jgi:hypothetical protein
VDALSARLRQPHPRTHSELRCEGRLPNARACESPAATVPTQERRFQLPLGSLSFSTSDTLNVYRNPSRNQRVRTACTSLSSDTLPTRPGAGLPPLPYTFLLLVPLGLSRATRISSSARCPHRPEAHRRRKPEPQPEPEPQSEPEPVTAEAEGRNELSRFGTAEEQRRNPSPWPTRCAENFSFWHTHSCQESIRNSRTFSAGPPLLQRSLRGVFLDGGRSTTRAASTSGGTPPVNVPRVDNRTAQPGPELAEDRRCRWGIQDWTEGNFSSSSSRTGFPCKQASSMLSSRPVARSRAVSNAMYLKSGTHYLFVRRPPWWRCRGWLSRTAHRLANQGSPGIHARLGRPRVPSREGDFAAVIVR